MLKHKSQKDLQQRSQLKEKIYKLEIGFEFELLVIRYHVRKKNTTIKNGAQFELTSSSDSARTQLPEVSLSTRFSLSEFAKFSKLWFLS